MFDHEKLEVYQIELQFVEWVTLLLEEIKGCKVTSTREVRDQLDRASLSSLLNTAEGNGKWHRRLRAKFFEDARGSATECAACLDALVAKRVCAFNRVVEGKGLLLRIVQMLTKLVQLHSEGGFIREEPSEYDAFSVDGLIEHEHDDDHEYDWKRI